MAKMTLRHYLTLLLGMVLAITPQLISSIPPAYADTATAAVTLLTSLYHLLQTAPADVKN